MASAFSLSVDKGKLADLDRVLDGIKNGTRKVLTSALNRTATSGRTIVVKRLTAELNLKAKEVRDTLRIKKATWEKLEAGIVISKKPISLMAFSPKPNQPIRKVPPTPGAKPARAKKRVRGVSVKTRKGKPRELLKGTFIARMKSGHIGVYERQSRIPGRKIAVRRVKKPDGTWSELPISERFGPTPVGVFANAPNVAAEVMSKLDADLLKNIDSQVNRLLNRKKSDPPT